MKNYSSWTVCKNVITIIQIEFRYFLYLETPKIRIIGVKKNNFLKFEEDKFGLKKLTLNNPGENWINDDEILVG